MLRFSLVLGWVDVDVETEANLRFGLMLGWDDVESKFSWNWVEVGEGLENFLEVNFEQLSFSMFP